MTTQLLDLDDLKALCAARRYESGARVRQLRELRGWTVRQLAELVGVTEASVSRVETGSMSASEPLKVALANALAVEPSELWVLPSRDEAVRNAAVA